MNRIDEIATKLNIPVDYIISELSKYKIIQSIFFVILCAFITLYLLSGLVKYCKNDDYEFDICSAALLLIIIILCFILTLIFAFNLFTWLFMPQARAIDYILN